MGRDLAKRMFLVLTPILLLPLFISSSSGGSVNSSENGVRIPKSADFELLDLDLCGKVFHGKTTCSASQNQSASLAAGEASEDFLDMFAFLECSICHLNVESQSESPCICASVCERVFEACSDASLSSIASFDNNSKASKQGFTVQTSDDSKEEPFNGSKASLEPVMKSESSEDKTEMVKLFKVVNQQLITCVIALVLKGIMIYIRRLDQQDMMAAMNQDAGNMNGNA